MEFLRKTIGAEQAAIVVVVLVSLLVQQPIACVSAESDSHMLHLESVASYHYQIWGDSISCNDLLTGDKSAVSELRNLDVNPVLSPTVTFSTDLPVSWTDGELIDSDKYLWTFDDLQVGEWINPGVWFDGSVVFAPDLSASRTMTETVFTSPEGMQTVTLTFTLARETPSEEEFVDYEPFLIAFGVDVWEDENVDPAIDPVNVELPSVDPEKGEGLVIHSRDEHKVSGFIQNPTVGTTYTLVVPIVVRLKEGIDEVEYKPHVSVINRFAHWLDTPFGRGVTVDTEVGTWVWATGSQHSWLCWNSLQKYVEFLPHSHMLPLRANVEIDPETVNLKSNGNWITAYIELPPDHDVNDIDVSSVNMLVPNHQEQPIDRSVDAPSIVGDYDSDGMPDLAVKFDRATVVAYLRTSDVADDDTGTTDEVILTVSGQVAGLPFTGSDTIRVIEQRK